MSAHLKASLKASPALQHSDERHPQEIQSPSMHSRSYSANGEAKIHQYKHVVVVDPSWNPAPTHQARQQPSSSESGAETQLEMQARLIRQGMDPLTAHFKASLAVHPDISQVAKSGRHERSLIKNRRPPATQPSTSELRPSRTMSREQVLEQQLIEGGMEPIDAHVKALILVKHERKDKDSREDRHHGNKGRGGNSNSNTKAGGIMQHSAVKQHTASGQASRGKHGDHSSREGAASEPPASLQTVHDTHTPHKLRRPHALGSNHTTHATMTSPQPPVTRDKPVTRDSPVTRDKSADKPVPPEAMSKKSAKTATPAYLYHHRGTVAIVTLACIIILAMAIRRLGGSSSIDDGLDAHKMSWKRAAMAASRPSTIGGWEPVVDDITGRRKRRAPKASRSQEPETEMTPLKIVAAETNSCSCAAT
jgi:hypothetical protein